MMKKLIMLLTICMMCLLAVSASAAEKNDEAPPINWEISMMPKPTAEEIEAARWSIVLENTMGVYAYDMDSLYFPEEKNGVVNKDLVNVIVKTVFTDKELLKKQINGQLAIKMNIFQFIMIKIIMMKLILKPVNFLMENMQAHQEAKKIIIIL